ncbi:hypothetical protein [Pseudomonas sp. A-B-19]|uniref:hypothetical protein n=1 Tax=Pseudomonas sp. A-B-19 TaxID=2832405 RepID=UPI001CBC3620|nr:hypothetical protein [Pseudomonas sp. A-B-19]
MIQNKAMGSFNCSFMNIDVREKILGRIFLLIELNLLRFVVFILLLFAGSAAWHEVVLQGLVDFTVGCKRENSVL